MSTYSPETDGKPDPGEIVWAWVPYEDDPQQGKDRPVLVLEVHEDGDEDGADTGTCVALMLTSKDHDRDAADEASHGRFWMDIGAGEWDSRRRPSEVRLDRRIVLDLDAVRREGSALGEQLFETVVEAASLHDR